MTTEALNALIDASPYMLMLTDDTEEPCLPWEPCRDGCADCDEDDPPDGQWANEEGW